MPIHIPNNWKVNRRSHWNSPWRTMSHVTQKYWHTQEQQHHHQKWKNHHNTRKSTQFYDNTQWIIYTMANERRWLRLIALEKLMSSSEKFLSRNRKKESTASSSIIYSQCRGGVQVCKMPHPSSNHRFKCHCSIYMAWCTCTSAGTEWYQNRTVKQK